MSSTRSRASSLVDRAMDGNYPEAFRDNDLVTKDSPFELGKRKSYQSGGHHSVHLYLGHPVIGLSIEAGICDADDPDKMMKQSHLNDLRAMSFLHQHGICHGGEYTRLKVWYHTASRGARYEPPSLKNPSLKNPSWMKATQKN
ncbi:hypothetical protein F4778DRAFT_748343 [Xylariomycetidae sp. FL2044]|nr:hypothetical protein F4778DRAFT_748343 [Xylariomycetidae sp. FL2044]